MPHRWLKSSWLSRALPAHGSVRRCRARVGEREAAPSTFRRATELTPDSREAWLGLAGAVEHLAKKRTCFERVLRLDPENTDALTGLAWVARDLVVDRRPLFDRLKSLKLFPIAQEKAVKSPADLAIYSKPAGCLECLCCHSGCAAAGDSAACAGPFVMVKLAQMHFHPQDGYDRRRQARELGIERLLDGQDYPCPYGINIPRDDIAPLLA